jgi:DTW domain-containing protein
VSSEPADGAQATRARGFRVPRCGGCALSLELCVCRIWPPLACEIQVSVVMPRSEQRSASNSARLLGLWLPESERFVRGAGIAPDPAALVERPGSALLFPSPSGESSVPLSSVRHLIVPDGTWSQARRIDRHCFGRYTLPRVSLSADWPSVYELRRARAGLCTFEAIAIAIGLLSNAAVGCILLDRFSEWAARARALKAGGALGRPELRSAAAVTHPAARRLHTE